MLARVILHLPQNSPAGWVTPPYGAIKALRPRPNENRYLPGKLHGTVKTVPYKPPEGSQLSR